MRATVRDPDDAERLRVLKALPGAAARLSLWKADLLVPGSFDAAVEGAFRGGGLRLSETLCLWWLDGRIDPDRSIDWSINGRLVDLTNLRIKHAH